MTDVHPAPEDAATDKRLASHLRVRRSQAQPKRTLFGSALEQLSDAEARRLAEEGASAEARAAYQDGWKPVLRERPPPQPLPDELAAFLRARHGPDIEQQARQVDEWRRRLRVRERRLNLMERDAKYVFELPHPLESLPDAPRNYGPRPRWMTAGDLSHSAEVNPNFMGPGVRNFNRDKYKKLAQSHSYALVGDPMRQGMEFDSGPVDTELQLPPPMPINARPDRLVLTPRTEQRRQAMRRLPPSSELINGVEVPMRLKHQFGSEVCQSLLGDRDVVLETSRRMQQRDQAANRSRDTAAGADQQKPALLQTGDPGYEALGNALRANVFGRGHSLNQRVSSNHEDFSGDQFSRREPVPDQHRYQKDHVSRWAEANVLEMRMKRALQERMDRMLRKKKTEE